MGGETTPSLRKLDDRNEQARVRRAKAKIPSKPSDRSKQRGAEWLMWRPIQAGETRYTSSNGSGSSD